MKVAKFKYEFLLMFFSIAVSGIVSVPSIRNWIFEATTSADRTILSSVNGDITGNGDPITVVKIQSLNTISLEVILHNGDQTRVKDIRRILLDSSRDMYFDVKDYVTNLALVDINNDGILEIVTATADENLIPRLHIYRYDTETEDFLKVGPDFMPSI